MSREVSQRNRRSSLHRMAFCRKGTFSSTRDACNSIFQPWSVSIWDTVSVLELAGTQEYRCLCWQSKPCLWVWHSQSNCSTPLEMKRMNAKGQMQHYQLPWEAGVWKEWMRKDKCSIMNSPGKRGSRIQRNVHQIRMVVLDDQLIQVAHACSFWFYKFNHCSDNKWIGKNCIFTISPLFGNRWCSSSSHGIWCCGSSSIHSNELMNK